MTSEYASNTPESIRDLWQTPRAIFESLNKEFHFVLDVAAAEHNALCSSFITAEAEGLMPGAPEVRTRNTLIYGGGICLPWIRFSIDFLES